MIRSHTKDQPVHDRLPPHSPDGERGILGCIILGANPSFDEATSLSIAPDAFYDLRHQCIWKALGGLVQNGISIDLITLRQRLIDMGKFEEIGGLTYLSEIADCVPSAANMRYYVDMVREKAVLRSTIKTCAHIINEAYEALPCDSAQVLDAAERDILLVRDQHAASVTEIPSMRDVVGRSIDTLEARMLGRNGVSTGFQQIDRRTGGGLHDSELWLVAGRPSTGKTALVMNIADSVATRMRQKWTQDTGGEGDYTGESVGIFSLEMTDESLVERLASARSGVNTKWLDALTEKDQEKLQVAMGQTALLPLHIDDTPGQTVSSIRAKARRLHQRKNARLFIVDYLQLIANEPGLRENDRRVAVDAISRGLKSLSRELKCPVIAVAQLNRDFEREKSRKPRMSDLRESGQIEQDADLIGILYPAKEDKTDGATDDGLAPFEVAFRIVKQRNGPRGIDIRFTFTPTLTRFDELALHTPGYE